MDNPEPFNRILKRKRRDRAFAGWDEHAFLQRHMADELLERLGSVKRDFKRALIVGYVSAEFEEALQSEGMETVTVDAGAKFARLAQGKQCDEDQLPFAAGSFDLVLSTGVLDTVNDLPGALVLARRILKPDGLFLAAFLGAGSLSVLRQVMLEADSLSGGAQPRIHPQIDLRAAGDLMGRAGFALQVADGEDLQVRYPDFRKLLNDLRGSANSSLMGGGRLTREQYAAASALFESHAVDGKTAESFNIIYLTGWSPAPEQPKPAARGSGTASLADALRPKS